MSEQDLETYRLALEAIADGGNGRERMIEIARHVLAGTSKGLGCKSRAFAPVDPPDPFAWARGAPLERGPRPLREGERR